MDPKQKEIWDRMVREANEKKKIQTSTIQSIKAKAKILNVNTVSSTVKPSQWVNFGWLLFAIFGCVLVIPVIIWICRVIIISCWSYHFGEKMVMERKGVFSVETVQVQYFRIKSIRVLEPFFQRLVGLSTVEVRTSEPFRPYLIIYGVKNGNAIKNVLTEKAEYWRDKMGVKETDFHNF
jgi:membrane protein YdbS with pleckstrin-like domain